MAAEVERARAARRVSEAELDKTVLRAPFDAIIARVEVEIGEWVTPSVALLAAPDVVDAIDPGSLYVSAPIDEVDSARLAVGQTARVTIDSHPGMSYPGRIARIAPFVLDVEAQNRTVEIEVELEDSAFSATLLPGTSADVEVILEVHEEVLRVPTYAIGEEGRVLCVEEGVLVERHVEVGARNWAYAEVRGGLEVGDEIVASLDRSGVEAGRPAIVEGSSGSGP
jgi:HlyD family secretion protein